MIDMTLLTLAFMTIASIVLGLCAVAGLRGFTAWIAFKRAELDRIMPAGTGASASNRIELADLKERLRKLEAIAAGVDL
jgi:hypothetical protein